MNKGGLQKKPLWNSYRNRYVLPHSHVKAVRTEIHIEKDTILIIEKILKPGKFHHLNQGIIFEACCDMIFSS